MGTHILNTSHILQTQLKNKSYFPYLGNFQSLVFQNRVLHRLKAKIVEDLHWLINFIIFRFLILCHPCRGATATTSMNLVIKNNFAVEILRGHRKNTSVNVISYTYECEISNIISISISYIEFVEFFL